MEDIHKEAADILYKVIDGHKKELAGTREAGKMGILSNAETKNDELRIQHTIEVLDWVIGLVEADAAIKEDETDKTERATEQKMKEYIAEKHLHNDAEPPAAAPGLWECPYCGVVYNRKPLLCCYAGCKRKVWENDGKRSNKQ